MKKTPLKRCQAKGCTKIARRVYEHNHDTPRHFCKRHFRQYVQKVMEQLEVIMTDLTVEERLEVTILGMLKAGLV